MKHKLAGKTHTEGNTLKTLTRKLQDNGDSAAWSEETVRTDVVASIVATSLQISVMKHANTNPLVYKGNHAVNSVIARHKTDNYSSGEYLTGLANKRPRYNDFAAYYGHRSRAPA